MNVVLERREVVCFRGNLRGMVLRCEGGSLWVTQGRDDHVLHAGDRLPLTGPGPVVVQAVCPAALTLVAPFPSDPVQIRWAGLPLPEAHPA